MIVAVDHVQITVPSADVEKARSFYCGLLGLAEVPKPDTLKDRGGFWLDAGGHQVHVGVEEGVDRRATKCTSHSGCETSMAGAELCEVRV